MQIKAQSFIPHSIRISPSFLYAFLSIMVGLASGSCVWLYKYLISISGHFFFTSLPILIPINHRWFTILIPILAGVVVGLVTRYLLGNEESKGVTSVIESCALGTGKLPYKKMTFRALASALSIGAGASVGPEDPSVQIGANFGSFVGKIFHLSEDKVKALIYAGVAAGIAAAFNAPIAGIFFSFEVLLGQINAYTFTYTALASVSSAILTQAISGNQPAFVIPAYAFQSISEIPFYLILGVLAGLCSAAYIFLIQGLRKIAGQIRLPIWALTAITGMVIGIVGLFAHELLGIGYSTISGILTNQEFPISLLIGLLIGKMIMTPFSIAGGFIGGVFAPALFIGSVLGSLVAQVSGLAFPASNLTIPAFALVGMASVLAGTIRAPFTAILLLFEMTNDYHIILPLTLAVGISQIISKKIFNDSVYLYPLKEKGIFLQNGMDIGIIQTLKIKDIISPEVPSIPGASTMNEVMGAFSKTHRHGLPVVDENGKLFGMLTLQDIENLGTDSNTASLHAYDICSRNVQMVFPDDTVALAFQKMARMDIGRLPVVEFSQPDRLVGMVEREDIIRAYDLEITKRERKEAVTQKKHLSDYSGFSVYEIIIQKDSFASGQTISDIHWPGTMTITTIKRKGRPIFPHGSSSLFGGDILVILADKRGYEETLNICSINTQKQEIDTK